MGASMRLIRRIPLLRQSSERLIRALALPRDKAWWRFMRREAWLHLRLSLGLFWAVLRKKE